MSELSLFVFLSFCFNGGHAVRGEGVFFGGPPSAYRNYSGGCSHDQWSLFLGIIWI